MRLITATNRDLEQEIQRGQLPRGPLLPAQRGAASTSRRCASGARTSRCSSSHFITQVQRAAEEGDHRHRAARRSSALVRVQLAGQHPRARERARADDAVLRGRRASELRDLPRRARRRAAARDAPRPRARPSRPTAAGGRRRRRRRGDAGGAGGSLKDIVRAETERVERELIVQALDETGGNVTQAAQAAQDQPQEPADEDEGVRPARPRGRPLARGDHGRTPLTWWIDRAGGRQLRPRRPQRPGDRGDRGRPDRRSSQRDRQGGAGGAGQVEDPDGVAVREPGHHDDPRCLLIGSGIGFSSAGSSAGPWATPAPPSIWPRWPCRSASSARLFGLGTIIFLIYPVLILVLVNTTFKDDLVR